MESRLVLHYIQEIFDDVHTFSSSDKKALAALMSLLSWRTHLTQSTLSMA